MDSEFSERTGDEPSGQRLRPEREYTPEFSESADDVEASGRTPDEPRAHDSDGHVALDADDLRGFASLPTPDHEPESAAASDEPAAAIKSTSADSEGPGSGAVELDKGEYGPAVPEAHADEEVDGLEEGSDDSVLESRAQVGGPGDDSGESSRYVRRSTGLPEPGPDPYAEADVSIDLSSDDWTDERPAVDPDEQSRYVRRSAWLPELGPDHDHQVDAELKLLRRASERFLPRRFRRTAPTRQLPSRRSDDQDTTG